MLTEGTSYTHSFSFSQAQVEAFAQITGDTNPLHLDAAYAQTTPFKQPILHGFLGASVFSKIFGTLFPGEGTVYLKQSLEFLRPMYPDVPYTATVTIRAIDAAKHTALVETQITDSAKGKIATRGEAIVLHTEMF